MNINFDLATCILKSGNGWAGADGVKKGFYFKSNLEKFNESLLSYIKSLGSATKVIGCFGVDFKIAKLRILKLNSTTNINHNAYLDLYNVSGNLLKTITINLTDNAFAICNDDKTLCQPADYSTYFSLSSMNYTSLFPVINPYSLDVQEPSIVFEEDFDWVTWATKEKAKLDNYKKGYDIKFWTTGKKMSSSAVILGGTLGFSVNGAKYTLEDIISGTLSKEALGKTFAEGIAKCKGIWLRIGGILGAILESSIVKTITGVFTTGGLFYVSYALFTKLMDYTQSLTGSMDEVSYPGWWTQGTTYTEDSTTGSGMAVVPSTNTGAVDNWENYAYTNTDSNGNVGTGATESGTTVNQGNSNLGTVTLATGATVALGIATGTAVPLTVPETTKVGLNILDGQAISLDTSEALASPLPMQPVEWNNNVPPPWFVNPIELHLSNNLANYTVPNIKIDPPVIPPLTVSDVNVKVDVNVPSIPNIDVNVPTIPNIKIDTPTLPNIQVDGSAITLTAPESIPLTAPTEPVPMTFDTTSAEAIKAISDNIASRNELETTRAEADTAIEEATKVLRDLQIENEQFTKDNKQVLQDKLDADLFVVESEMALRKQSFGTGENQLDYVPAQVQAYNNLHDIADRESILLGQKLMFPQGLIPSLVAAHFPALLGEIQQSKITDNIVDNVDNHKDDLMNNEDIRNLLFGEMWFDMDTLIKQDLKTKYGDILDEFDGLEFNNSIIDTIINKCLEVKEKMGV